MSCCTLGVAVAVSAIIGTLPISSIIGLIFLYSGLKSCPHSEIQWASSIATKDIVTDLRNSAFSSLVKDSGATYNSFVFPFLTSSRTCLNCVLFKEEFIKCAIESSSL